MARALDESALWQGHRIRRVEEAYIRAVPRGPLAVDVDHNLLVEINHKVHVEPIEPALFARFEGADSLLHGEAKW